MKCRFCSNSLTREFVDLGFSPPSNSFLASSELNKSEIFYPLKTWVCEACYLVQIDEFEKHDSIFDSEYVYFSSYSKSWLKHCEEYVNMVYNRFSLNESTQVIEIASNDGYLLQYFKDKNVSVLGIEPTSNTAEVAKNKGIDTWVDFFSINLANKLISRGIKADLLIGNNVLAHVPNINDFVGGMKIVLNDRGIITLEFPHLLKLIDQVQFDTIYHEHFSYFSLYTVSKIFNFHALEIFDVEEVETHGGSLRVFIKHKNDLSKIINPSVDNLIKKEISYGLNSLDIYQNFQNRVEIVKNKFLSFLTNAYLDGKVVLAYGAAAKGNTLLNFSGIRKDLINYVVDKSPHKIGKFLPGVHIPVVSEEFLLSVKPDYVVILPWNLKEEIAEQLHYIRNWGGKFVVSVPEIQVF